MSTETLEKPRESVVGEPVVGEPVVGEPVVGESVVGESVVGESVVGGPVVGATGLPEPPLPAPPLAAPNSELPTPNSAVAAPNSELPTPRRAELPSSALLSSALLATRPPKMDIGVLGQVDELSPEEYMALLINEEILSTAYKNSIDAGLALVAIRDGKLYRYEYRTFPDYYRGKWQLDKSRVHYLTSTAELHRAITAGTELPIPQYASQLRPLIGLNDEQARLAWKYAVDHAGGRKLTHGRVRAAVMELKVRPEAGVKHAESRRERMERRQQLTQTMTDLLQLIIMHKPYEELVQKASALDQHVRFFFPPARKRTKN
jgi:hypothetical protein